MATKTKFASLDEAIAFVMLEERRQVHTSRNNKIIAALAYMTPDQKDDLILELYHNYNFLTTERKEEWRALCNAE
jgi:hypothetical protein